MLSNCKHSTAGQPFVLEANFPSEQESCSTTSASMWTTADILLKRHGPEADVSVYYPAAEILPNVTAQTCEKLAKLLKGL